MNLVPAEDTAIRGVLWRSRGAWLVIRNPEILHAGKDPKPLPGEVVIHRDQVAFLQAQP